MTCRPRGRRRRSPALHRQLERPLDASHLGRCWNEGRPGRGAKPHGCSQIERTGNGLGRGASNAKTRGQCRRQTSNAELRDNFPAIGRRTGQGIEARRIHGRSLQQASAGPVEMRLLVLHSSIADKRKKSTGVTISIRWICRLASSLAGIGRFGGNRAISALAGKTTRSPARKA